MAIVQNSDTEIEFTLTDGTTAYVINNLNAYEVYIYNVTVTDKILLATFKNTNTGVYAIEVASSATGKIRVILNREMTRNLASGKVFAEIRIRVTADAEFISSRQNLGITGIEIATAQTSANPNSLN